MVALVHARPSANSGQSELLRRIGAGDPDAIALYAPVGMTMSYDSTPATLWHSLRIVGPSRGKGGYSGAGLGNRT
jgi:hypothetical protein